MDRLSNGALLNDSLKLHEKINLCWFQRIKKKKLQKSNFKPNLWNVGDLSMQSGCLQDLPPLSPQAGTWAQVWTEQFAKQLSTRRFSANSLCARPGNFGVSSTSRRLAFARVANLSAFPTPPRPLRRRLHPGGVCLRDVIRSKQSPPLGASGRRVSRAAALLPLKGQ